MLTPVLYGSNRFFAHTKSIRVYTLQEQKETEEANYFEIFLATVNSLIKACKLLVTTHARLH
jgi:hypothetical protein